MCLYRAILEILRSSSTLTASRLPPSAPAPAVLHCSRRPSRRRPASACSCSPSATGRPRRLSPSSRLSSPRPLSTPSSSSSSWSPCPDPPPGRIVPPRCKTWCAPWAMAIALATQTGQVCIIPLRFKHLPGLRDRQRVADVPPSALGRRPTTAQPTLTHTLTVAPQTPTNDGSQAWYWSGCDTSSHRGGVSYRWHCATWCCSHFRGNPTHYRLCSRGRLLRACPGDSVLSFFHLSRESLHYSRVMSRARVCGCTS